jgi:LmbE family N-acetylglucosaminyl deacetylase
MAADLKWLHLKVGRLIVLLDPIEVFQGTLIIMAPHMDDEVLACGGTIARLPQKERIHVVYATDGMKSPAPEVPWRDSISSDLGKVRMREAQAAMACLGVSNENIHFLSLPDGQLAKHTDALIRLLTELIGQIEPAHILMPFRYDSHPDHLALNHVITAARRQGEVRAELTEYFVYYRWRLLPAGDVRKYIHPDHLFEVTIDNVSDRKRAALSLFKTQTTKFYAWQPRPNLSAWLLDEVSRTPELFLRYDPTASGPAVFYQYVTWIRLVHRLEPFLKKRKNRVVALWTRGLGRNDRQAA